VRERSWNLTALKEMVERRVRVCNALGLHARPAAQLVLLTEKFESSVRIHRLDSEISADAKSILDILYVAASCGTELIISADGKDSETALDAVEELFANGFGE
jgi:phosphotransferase system HPr (HPr) family protein